MTQLFVGGLSLGTSELGFKAWHNTKAFNRWVRFRNASTYKGEQFFVGAGATWQFGIPSDALEFFHPEGSDALAELQTAANNHRGILVQFGMYLAEPELTDVDLYEQFQNGYTPENAVQPLIVGTLGVWEDDGELETAPAGRLMRTPLGWPPPSDVIDPAAKFLGPALARVHPKRNVVSLNLITTFPEADYNHPPEKADLGRVRLGYVASTGGSAVPISGPLAYDAETYELTGGILDVRYDHRRVSHSELQRGTLVLLGESKCDGSQIVMLTEEGSTTTVATDDFGLHLDVGDVPNNSANIRILVRERDRPPSKDVTVYLREYQFAGGPAEFQHRASFQLTLVEDGPPLEHRICFEREVVFPAGKKDTMDVPITACRPGGVALAFTLEDRAFQEAWPWDTAFYTAVRVMPDDDYSSICQDVRVCFDFMYANVFRYYYVIFPVMSEIIPFNCKQAMEDAADGFVSVTDPKLIDTTMYMPISRDLSTGKRNLIVEWAEYVKRKKKGGGG